MKENLKRISIAGGIGNTPRQNRDCNRVLRGGNCVIALKAHIAQEPPYVLKKWKRK